MDPIRIERDYDYSPAQVWQALTDPHAVAAWLMTTDIKPVVGHKFQLRAKPQPGWRGIVDGVVLEAAAERRLVYSWQGDPKGKPTTVAWTLVPTARGTRLILEHSGFTGIGGWFSRMMMAPGWRKMLHTRLLVALAAVAQNRTDTLQPRYPPM
jgi:uncharacterized protein YndB with AHSA1/START domain